MIDNDQKIIDAIEVVWPLAHADDWPEGLAMLGYVLEQLGNGTTPPDQFTNLVDRLSYEGQEALAQRLAKSILQREQLTWRSQPTIDTTNP